MIEVLKRLVPNFSHFDEIKLESGPRTLGHQTTMILKDGTPFAGGTNKDLNIARRICAAEAIERAYFLRTQETENADLLAREYPTTCGFAAGFESQKAAYRAICEAIERWCWSKWIDDGFTLEKAESANLNELASYFASPFDRVLYLRKTIKLSRNQLLPSFMPTEYDFCVAVGLKGQGIFPGSRLTTSEDEQWEHPLLEAWRHFQIFKNELKDIKNLDIFDRRIFSFGSNGLNQLHTLLERPTRPEWPQPSLRILQELKTDGQYSVWRALCHDFVGWDKGDEKRFVY